MSYFRTDFTPPKNAETLSEKLYCPPHLHQQRLLAAVELYNYYPSGMSVLDVGCGFGHLYDHISGTVSRYLGVDKDPSVISYAKEKYGDSLFQVGSVETLDLSLSSDIVFCLGVSPFLNKSNEALKWFIEQLAHVARKAIIIEFQDSDKYNGHFTSFSKDEVSKACQRVFNKSMLVQRDNDTTFCVRVPLV